MHYLLLLIQERFYYLSVVAEIMNISYALSLILELNLPPGFQTILIVLNFIYAGYMLLVMFGTKGTFKRVSYAIITLSVLNHLFWNGNPIFSIIDSILCIGLLVYYHKFMYAIFRDLDEVAKESNV